MSDVIPSKTETHELLRQCAPHICSLLCPSVKREGETWAHVDLCRQITAALALPVETNGERYDPEYKLPCEVRLPIGMSIGKGVPLRTLMIAFRYRENWADEDTRFQDDRAKAIRKALGGAAPSYPASATDDGPCTTCNDSGWDCELQKPCDCDKGDLHRESPVKSKSERALDEMAAINQATGQYPEPSASIDDDPLLPPQSSVECPKCRTQLAFEGDECGLCKEDES